MAVERHQSSVLARRRSERVSAPTNAPSTSAEALRPVPSFQKRAPPDQGST